MMVKFYYLSHQVLCWEFGGGMRGLWGWERKGGISGIFLEIYLFLTRSFFSETNLCINIGKDRLD